MSWTLFHALSMSGLALLSWATGGAVIAAAGGAASLSALVFLRRAAWTPAGRFGAANAVTAFRAGLVVVLSAFTEAGPPAAALVLGIFCLDGVDGWLARRGPGSSAFGATFDMEADALLVLVAGLKLHECGRLGAWILVPGILRYAYAIAVAVLPSTRGEAPRSQLSRYAFSFVVASLVASFWPLHPLHPWLAALSTTLLVISFARSALWSFHPGVRRLA